MAAQHAQQSIEQVGISRSRFRTIGVALAGLITSLVVAVVVGAILVALLIKPARRGDPELGWASLIVEAADGRPLGRTGILKVNAGDFPNSLVQAVVSIEDRSFHSHWGVDLRSIIRALYSNLKAGEIVAGGSTITQQLVKLETGNRERTLGRKLREALTAVWLDLHIEKREILTRYLNQVYLGAGAYGMSAAARIYFDKDDLSQLTLSEAAMLAGLIKAPSLYNPIADWDAARSRAEIVLDSMVETGAIDEQTAEAAKASPAKLIRSSAVTPARNWFAHWIARHEFPKISGLREHSMRVRTTLRPDLQELAEGIVDDVLSGPGVRRNARQAALVALRHDGAILAMVGGRNYDESQFNRAVDAKRQPGSAFKLFVYLAALRSGYSLDHMVDASPLDIGGWRPKNFGRRRYEYVSLSNGFIHSINTAAVRLALNVGLDRVIATARDLGIDAELSPVPSLALGTIEVSLLDLTGAYASVLNGRAGIQPWGITAFGPAGGPMRTLGPPIGPKAPMVHRQEMIQLLQAVVDRGTGRAAAISGFAAGKTGTSQDYRNAWFIGFSDQLVVGVWVGNDDHSPMDRVTGGSLPAQIWKAFMRAAQPLISNERLVARGDATSTDGRGIGDLQEASDLTLRPVCNPPACDQRYRSFRASDCTYQPYHGPRMLCKIQAPKNQSATEVNSALEAHASGRSVQYCNHDRCASRYRSFDPNDCSYQPFGGGPRRICER